MFRNTYTYDRMHFYWIDFDKNCFEMYLNEVTILDSENIHIGWIKVELRGFSGNYSKKRGVTWFFRKLFYIKVDLRGFSGNYSKKSGVTWFFWELFFKKSGVTLFFRESLEIRGYSGKMSKKLSFSVFPCVDSRKRVHFWNFCHDSMMEDCSKIRNKA